jgi:long-subunit fatty acid transport protein
MGFLAAPSALGAGYYMGELGTRSLSRGGANVVNPRDPSAVWLNPAAISLSTGLQLQLNTELVWLPSSFTRTCDVGSAGCGPIDVNRDYGDGRTYSVDGSGRAAPDPELGYPIGDPRVGTDFGSLQHPDSVIEGQSIQNQAGVQAIPQLFLTFNTDSFGLDGLAFGLGAYAPQQGDYSFPEKGYTRYTLIDRDMLEFYYGATVAYRFRNWIAVGASLQGVSAGVKQSLAMSADPGGSEAPDYDIVTELDVVQHFIPSANFGLWTNPWGGLQFGASYQMGRKVRATGPITITPQQGLVEDFFENDLAAIEVADDASATVEFDLAPIIRVGAQYAHGDLMDVELAFVYEQWSSYDHVHVATEGVGLSVVGGDVEPFEPIVQPKDWQDAWSIRLGNEWHLMDDLLHVRGGAFYETSAIPNETHSVELVDGNKIGFGAGVGAKFFGTRLDVGYSLIHVLQRNIGDESIVFADNQAPPIYADQQEPRTRVAMGTYDANFHVLTVALNIAFDEMFGFGVHAPKESPHIPPPPPPPPPPTGGSGGDTGDGTSGFEDFDMGDGDEAAPAKVPEADQGDDGGDDSVPEATDDDDTDGSDTPDEGAGDASAQEKA